MQVLCVKRFLIALMGSVILFVVVCPITPTPIAVLDGKAHAVHTPAVVIASVAVIMLPRLDAPAWLPSYEGAPATSGASLLDMTCTRLC